MRRSRRGVSIIELMVILSAASVFLSLTGVVLQRVMRIHVQARADENAERTIARLSDQFRRDVHAAQQAATKQDSLPENVLLRLTFPGEIVADYSYANGKLSRSMSKPGGRVAREEYAFPSATIISIEEQDSPARLVLTASSSPGASEKKTKGSARGALSIPINLELQAVLGRDWQQGEAPLALETAP